MCATVSIGRASVDVMSFLLSLLKSSHPGLARAPIMCSHFLHGNEHVITCLALLFLASSTALELIQEPRHSLLSPSSARGKYLAVSLYWSWLIFRTRFASSNAEKFAKSSTNHLTSTPEFSFRRCSKCRHSRSATKTFSLRTASSHSFAHASTRTSFWWGA